MAGNRQKLQEGFRAQESRTLANFHKNCVPVTTQGAAKGGRQKEFDHSFSFSGLFRSPFGHFFWCFCHFLEEGKRPPHPTLSVLLGKRPVLLRADFVLTKDPRPFYYKTPPCLFYHKIALRKAILGPL